MPAPFGPITDTNEPGGTEIETPCRMFTSPYPATRSSVARIGAVVAHRSGALPVSPPAPPAPSPAWAPRYASMTAGITSDLLRGARGDHASLAHHDDPVGDVHHDLHVVLDEQERRPDVPAELQHVLQELAREGRVHPGRGLVEHHHVRRRHERPGELQELALPARERPGVCVGVLVQLDETLRRKARTLAKRDALRRTRHMRHTKHTRKARSTCSHPSAPASTSCAAPPTCVRATSSFTPA